jgi:Apea-like HEPN
VRHGAVGVSQLRGAAHQEDSEREPRNTRVLDIPQIRETIFGSPTDTIGRPNWELQAWESIVNDYFSLNNTVLFDQFEAELVSAQSILLAAGAPFFDTRSLYMLSSVIQTHRVAVFRNLGTGKMGFVAPGGMGPLLIDVAGIHERVPIMLKELRNTYGFAGFDDSPLHRSIKLFADFVARARRHEIDSRPNEALLHYVIALELIFGERQAIQKSVSERVALITFRDNGRSFAQQRDWIDTIYDLRSRYVHDGVEITNQLQLDQLRRLCEQIFRCLMRLQAGRMQPSSRGKEILTMWLHELDYLAKGLIAGKQPTETQFAEAFIA